MKKRHTDLSEWGKNVKICVPSDDHRGGDGGAPLHNNTEKIRQLVNVNFLSQTVQCLLNKLMNKMATMAKTEICNVSISPHLGWSHCWEICKQQKTDTKFPRRDRIPGDQSATWWQANYTEISHYGRSVICPYQKNMPSGFGFIFTVCRSSAINSIICEFTKYAIYCRNIPHTLFLTTHFKSERSKNSCCCSWDLLVLKGTSSLKCNCS